MTVTRPRRGGEPVTIAVPAPLTRGNFAPYGDVIAADGVAGHAVNDGRALRYDQPVAFGHREPARDAALALYVIEASRLPLTVDYLERHPASCQLFIPMSAGRYLIVVAEAAAEGNPRLETLRAFVATPGQAICYGIGVWHYPLVALDRAASFGMVMWQAPAAAEDCEIHPLEERVEVRR